MFEIIFIVGAIILGMSYLAIVGFFIYYHNQMFNHIMYNEPAWAQSTDADEEDTISMDELIKELKEDE